MFDISIHMKYQVLFSQKNNKVNFRMLSVTNLQSALMANKVGFFFFFFFFCIYLCHINYKYLGTLTPYHSSFKI